MDAMRAYVCYRQCMCAQVGPKGTHHVPKHQIKTMSPYVSRRLFASYVKATPKRKAIRPIPPI